MILLDIFIFALLVLLVGCLEIYCMAEGTLLEEIFDDGESHPILAWVLLPAGAVVSIFILKEGDGEALRDGWNSWLKSAGFTK